MTSTSSFAVQLLDVSKSFVGASHSLFDEFSLAIRPGESVALVGPSGSGKSTLLNILALLEPVDSGEVRYEGVVRTTRDAGTPRLGYIFQRDALLPWANVLDNVLLGKNCRGENGARVNEQAHELLKRVGLEGFADRFPDSLSGGQRQLVALVQNLLADVDVLLLDEPFAHLDFQSKLTLEAELLSVVRLARGAQRKPMTLILVTHDIEEAVTIADRLLVVGGYPARPTRIVREIAIDIPDTERDPIELRQGVVLPRFFRETWDAIRSIRPESKASA